MDTKTKYFGYDEEQIREVFRNSKDQVDVNSKIDDASTLSQLAESSGRLLKENRNFLREIYQWMTEQEFVEEVQYLDKMLHDFCEGSDFETKAFLDRSQ